MKSYAFPLTCAHSAGTYPGGYPSRAAGGLSITHGTCGGMRLAEARAILAMVSNHTDLDIARACQVILSDDRADGHERDDAQGLLSVISMQVIAQTVEDPNASA